LRFAICDLRMVVLIDICDLRFAICEWAVHMHMCDLHLQKIDNPPVGGHSRKSEIENFTTAFTTAYCLPPTA